MLSDLEMGVYGGATKHNSSYAGINASFVTAMVKGDSGNHWSIRWGDAQAGPLHTAFDGPRPSGDCEFDGSRSLLARAVAPTIPK
eukprot:SAG11_NODE_754_length_7332_cov_5.256325_6_plen_85_part_00